MRVICLWSPHRRIDVEESAFLKENSALQSLAEACLQITPRVSLARDSVFLEVESVLHFHGFQHIVDKIKSFAEIFSLNLQFGFGNDFIESRVQARFYPQVQEIKPFPIEALEDFANPYAQPLFEKAKLIHMITHLKNLGIHWIDQFVKLPLSELELRFGQLGYQIYSRILKREPVLWKNFNPQEKITEVLNIDVDKSVEGVEPLLFLTKNISQRMMARLHGLGLAPTKIFFQVHVEKYSTVVKPIREWTWSFSKAPTTVQQMLPLLRESLMRDCEKMPLEAPIIKIELTVLETKPFAGAQRDFLNNKEELFEAMSSLFHRLKERLGQRSVFMIEPVESYWPGRDWTRKLSLYEEDESFKVEESPLQAPPLRLLPKPIVIKREGLKLISSQKTWHVEELDTSEILSGEWWRGDIERAYARVLTREGDQLWIYMQKNSKDLYLHGFFD